MLSPSSSMYMTRTGESRYGATRATGRFRASTEIVIGGNRFGAAGWTTTSRDVWLSSMSNRESELGRVVS
jgi:hypothetical protein